MTAPTPANSPRSSAVASLVGEWKGSHDCKVIADVLTKYGFAAFVNEEVVAEGLIPGVTDASQLHDPKQPCLGAVTEDHWHFFTPDGAFGSLDKNRQQVDDGKYAILNDHEFTITGGTNTVPFTYHVSGDELRMEPAALGKTCTHGQWCQNIWMLVVTLPGQTWTRSG